MVALELSFYRKQTSELEKRKARLWASEVPQM